jgi:hypothetical protein
MTRRKPSQALAEQPPHGYITESRHATAYGQKAAEPSLKRKLPVTSPREAHSDLDQFTKSDSRANTNVVSDKADIEVQKILQDGRQKETDAAKETNRRRRDYLLLKALQIYDCACSAPELHTKIQDSHGVNIWLFDRSDWANVFFSAARICIQFSKETPLNEDGHAVLPRRFKCEGQLVAARDWKHQALYYLEQGRARSLLQSISRGSGVTDRERFVVWKTTRKAFGTVKDMSLVADYVLRSNRFLKKEESFASLPEESPTRTDTTKTGRLTESPAPILQTEISNQSDPDTARPTSLLATHTSSSVILSQPTDETRLTNMKIRMRWEKAFLFARTKNPNIGDVLLGDVEEMRANIPNDTIIVEYALASTSPRGVVTIVATSDCIHTAEWKETDTREIQRCISNLHQSMAVSQPRQGQSTSTARVTSPGPSRSYVRPSGPQRRASAACQEKLSNALYDAVVTPVRPYLAGKKKLIIIPSGELAHVPWAIFFNLPITVVPSLNIWTRLQTQSTSNSLSTQDPQIFVVSNAPKDREKEKRNLPAIRDIPYSRIEALCIARRHNKLPFIADDKDQEEFKTEAEGMHILHLCAHSTFDHDAPMSSSIQLSNKPLRMSHWRQLSISAELVIFSSCLSGM